MKVKRRLTLALPVVLILAGLLVPTFVDSRSSSEAPTGRRPARHAGHTAPEWAVRGKRALARGRFDRAISYLKTAERAEPGTQYARELADARRARRRAVEAERNRERLLDGVVHDLSFDSEGRVTAGRRTTIVLPGESLWTLAERYAAAVAGVAPSEVDERAVYAVWDQLTDLNGMRELEVGEAACLPLPDGEMEAFAAANRADLERLERGRRALARGDLEEAERMRDAVRGVFVSGSDGFAEFAASVDLVRQQELLGHARSLVEDVAALSRIRHYDEIVAGLEDAERTLLAAKAMRGGSQCDPPLASVRTMLAELGRYDVGKGGTVRTVKPAGKSYVETAREAVEWLLERELAWSGKQHPHSSEKTPDERGWASYLGAASEMATSRGVDFAGLLTAIDDELVVELPSPAGHFSY